jgi:hypothetical protein
MNDRGRPPISHPLPARRCVLPQLQELDKMNSRQAENEYDLRTVDTYGRLERTYRSWVSRAIPMLLVVGRGGTGKTHEYEHLLPVGSYHLFRGRTSAYTMYKTVMEHPDIPIVFDDVESLMKDPASRDLMKQLAETTTPRVVRWSTNAVAEDQRTFHCTSNVLILANNLPKKDGNLDAITSRFDRILFDPTKAEVIARMRTFAQNEDDVDIIADAAVMPSLRTLIHFQDWKKSELDPLEELYAACGVPGSVLIIKEIMETVPKRKWITTYATRTDRNYEAAKRDWGRKKNLAKQLLEAAGPREPCPFVPVQAVPATIMAGTKGH